LDNRNNIIPDEAELGLTVRSYKPEIRKQLRSAIERIVKAEAAASGATLSPRIEQVEATDAVRNDPALAERLRPTLESALGREHVVIAEPSTASEDFSYFIAQGVPSFFFGLGGAEPSVFTRANSAGEELPSNHSALFAPDLDPSLRTGIVSEVAVLRQLLNQDPAR
jgi:metal-dependent amidase/aminoacylase/carboxypeptidase family protein